MPLPPSVQRTGGFGQKVLSQCDAGYTIWWKKKKKKKNMQDIGNRLKRSCTLAICIRWIRLCALLEKGSVDAKFQIALHVAQLRRERQKRQTRGCWDFWRWLNHRCYSPFRMGDLAQIKSRPLFGKLMISTSRDEAVQTGQMRLDSSIMSIVRPGHDRPLSEHPAINPSDSHDDSQRIHSRSLAATWPMICGAKSRWGHCRRIAMTFSDRFGSMTVIVIVSFFHFLKNSQKTPRRRVFAVIPQPLSLTSLHAGGHLMHEWSQFSQFSNWSLRHWDQEPRNAESTTTSQPHLLSLTPWIAISTTMLQSQSLS